MHGLVEAPHVDHLHPDSGIALAAAADGEELTRHCFGDRVAWVPWRRPVSRQAAKLMTVQAMGGDIVYICSKNAVFAGPSNVAYGAAKANQAHQVRLLTTGLLIRVDAGVAAAFLR